jgi:hypothetical protein
MEKSKMADIADSEELEGIDYFEKKRPERTYISKSFDGVDFSDAAVEVRRMRIMSRVFDPDESPLFARIRREDVLRITPGERHEIKIVFCEDTRDIKHITIQRFTRKDGKPHKTGFTLSGSEIEKLYNMLRLVRYADLGTADKIRLDEQVFNEWLTSTDERRKYFLEHSDLVMEIAKHHITKSDVVAFAYRKSQLGIFEGLLTTQQFFESKKAEWKVRGPEAVWQTFFEANPWIFGYGLNYIFTSQLDDKKLEQVTSGYNFQQTGKRADALMKTRGLISSLCFVEMKTHETSLLYHAKPYRAESWRVSDELAGSVAQVQKTVQKAIKDIQTKIEFQNDYGEPTGETAFLYQPKAYVVIGCLDEFITDKGINEQKYSSFELFRRNVLNPEIITFDELYERAKFIVQRSEAESSDVQQLKMPEEYAPEDVDAFLEESFEDDPFAESEIPF